MENPLKNLLVLVPPKSHLCLSDPLQAKSKSSASNPLLYVLTASGFSCTDWSEKAEVLKREEEEELVASPTQGTGRFGVLGSIWELPDGPTTYKPFLRHGQEERGGGAPPAAPQRRPFPTVHARRSRGR